MHERDRAHQPSMQRRRRPSRAGAPVGRLARGGCAMAQWSPTPADSARHGHRTRHRRCRHPPRPAPRRRAPDLARSGRFRSQFPTRAFQSSASSYQWCGGRRERPWLTVRSSMCASTLWCCMPTAGWSRVMALPTASGCKCRAWAGCGSIGSTRSNPEESGKQRQCTRGRVQSQVDQFRGQVFYGLGGQLSQRIRPSALIGRG